MKGIKRLMRRALLTPDGLASKMGVSRQAVYAWLNGSSWPRAEHIRKLAEVLGVDVNTVLDALEETEQEKQGVA